MKKAFLALLFILLAENNVSAQVFDLDEDYDANPYISEIAIIYNSIIPLVTISGHIESEVSTTIKAKESNIIIVKASEAVFAAPSGGSKGTVIRPKPGFCIGCKKTIPISPKIDAFLNQADNAIEINSHGLKMISYCLYDITGKAIASANIPPTTNHILDTSGLKNAVYIVKIEFEDQSFKAIKFIKN